jgi:ankyrin repeat protein
LRGLEQEGYLEELRREQDWLLSQREREQLEQALRISQDAAQSGLRLEDTDSAGQGRPLPAFFCPITAEIMRDPVTTADGQTYERAAIERWFESSDMSPATGANLPSKTVVPNIALRKAVEEWEHAYALHVRRANIELEGPALAAGSFKTVYRGTLRLHVQGGGSRTVTVAVLKMRRGDCTTEAGMFLKLGRHPRLVRFMGQCLEGDEHFLLIEFAALGSLSDAFETWEDTITLHHNLFILQQIAEGMEHLTANAVVHRDLAARNVLVFAFDPQVVSATSVKITDYGLSTSMYNRSHVTIQQGEVPYRYLSEEAILKGRFGEASDVWAFGVLAWELLTLGYIPYAKFTDDQKVVEFVTGGGRLSKEEVTCECPDALWSIMVRCWSKKPRDRPTFSSLVAALQTLRATSCNCIVYWNLTDEEAARKTDALVVQDAIDAAEASRAKEQQERADAELARRLHRQLQLEEEGEAQAAEEAKQKKDEQQELDAELARRLQRELQVVEEAELRRDRDVAAQILGTDAELAPLALALPGAWSPQILGTDSELAPAAAGYNASDVKDVAEGPLAKELQERADVELAKRLQMQLRIDRAQAAEEAKKKKEEEEAANSRAPSAAQTQAEAEAKKEEEELEDFTLLDFSGTTRLLKSASSFSSSSSSSSSSAGAASTPENEEALLAAVYNGDEPKVRELIKAGTNVDCRNADKWSPLHVTAYLGHVSRCSGDMKLANVAMSLAKLLLDSNANVDALDKIKWTPLHQAARYGHDTMTKLLLDSKANVNALDNASRTPLHAAAYNGKRAIVARLLEYKAEINARDKNGDTPLKDAQKRGHRTVASLLSQMEEAQAAEEAKKKKEEEEEAANSEAANSEAPSAAQTKAEADAKKEEDEQEDFTLLDFSGTTRLLKSASSSSSSSSSYSSPGAASTPQNEEALLAAGENGDEPKVRELIKAGTNVDCQNAEASYARDVRYAAEAPRAKPYIRIYTNILLREAQESAAQELQERADVELAKRLQMQLQIEGAQAAEEVKKKKEEEGVNSKATSAAQAKAEAEAKNERKKEELPPAGAASTPQNQEALLAAAENGEEPKVRELIKAGTNVDCQNADRGLPPTYQTACNL